MKISTKIREIRKITGLSQTEFAKILGIKTSQMSYIESGERSLTADLAIIICDYFDLSLDWLMRDRGEPPSRTQIVQRYETLLTSKEKQGFGA